MKSIAAMTAVTAIPGGVALAARVGTAGVAPVMRANLYTWSAMIARTKGVCSPELLVKTLNVDPARANFLFGRLVSNNVVNATGSTIVSQTQKVLKSNNYSKTIDHSSNEDIGDIQEANELDEEATEKPDEVNITA